MSCWRPRLVTSLPGTGWGRDPLLISRDVSLLAGCAPLVSVPRVSRVDWRRLVDAPGQPRLGRAATRVTLPVLHVSLLLARS